MDVTEQSGQLVCWSDVTSPPPFYRSLEGMGGPGPPTGLQPIVAPKTKVNTESKLPFGSFVSPEAIANPATQAKHAASPARGCTFGTSRVQASHEQTPPLVPASLC